jgi:hypothetical protein
MVSTQVLKVSLHIFSARFTVMFESGVVKASVVVISPEILRILAKECPLTPASQATSRADTMDVLTSKAMLFSQQCSLTRPTSQPTNSIDATDVLTAMCKKYAHTRPSQDSPSVDAFMNKLTAVCKQHSLTFPLPRPPTRPSVDAAISMILAKQCPLTAAPSKTTCDDTERPSTAKEVFYFGLLLIVYFGLLLIVVAEAIKNWTPEYWETTATSCTTQSTHVEVPAVKNATSAFNQQPTLETTKAILADAAIMEQGLIEDGRVIDPILAALAMNLAMEHHTTSREIHTLKTTMAILADAATIKQALEESGRVYDPSLAMHLAIANHKTSREIYAREQAELQDLYDKVSASHS